MIIYPTPWTPKPWWKLLRVLSPHPNISLHQNLSLFPSIRLSPSPVFRLFVPGAGFLVAEGVTEEEILEDWEKIKENMEEVKGGGGGEGEFFWSSGMLEEFFKSLAEKEGVTPPNSFFSLAYQSSQEGKTLPPHPHDILCQAIRAGKSSNEIDAMLDRPCCSCFTYKDPSYFQTCLHVAAELNNLAICKVLVKRWREISKDQNSIFFDSRDKNQWTALHLACHLGHIEIVDFFLQEKFSVLALTSGHSVPLHHLVRHPFPLNPPSPILPPSPSLPLPPSRDNRELFEEVLGKMVGMGVNPDAKDVDGESVLHKAALSASEVGVEVLLKLGVQINSFNIIANETPLHYAARQGHTGVVELLLAEKPLLVKGKFGTPTDVAAQAGHNHLQALFTSYTPPVSPPSPSPKGNGEEKETGDNHIFPWLKEGTKEEKKDPFAEIDDLRLKFRDPVSGVRVKTRYSLSAQYDNSFFGWEAVAWIMGHANCSRKEALCTGRWWASLGDFSPCQSVMIREGDSLIFGDTYTLFHFSEANAETEASLPGISSMRKPATESKSSLSTFKRPHDFVGTTVTVPVFCTFCQRRIWGFFVPAFVCTRCSNYVIHQECHSLCLIQSTCDESPSSTPSVRSVSPLPSTQTSPSRSLSPTPPSPLFKSGPLGPSSHSSSCLPPLAVPSSQSIVKPTPSSGIPTNKDEKGREEIIEKKMRKVEREKAKVLFWEQMKGKKKQKTSKMERAAAEGVHTWGRETEDMDRLCLMLGMTLDDEENDLYDDENDDNNFRSEYIFEDDEEDEEGDGEGREKCSLWVSAKQSGEKIKIPVKPKPIPKISEICKGRLNRKELRTLFHHFDGLRSPGKTFVQKEEFSKKLGFILNESGLSNQMFDRLNESRSGKLTFLEFVQGMSVMMKGTPSERILYAFSMFCDQPNQNRIRLSQLETLTAVMHRALGKIQLTSMYDKPEELVDNIFKNYDVDGDGWITDQEYLSACLSNPLYLQSLGLVSTPTDKPSQVPILPSSRKKVFSSHAKRPLNIVFGHPSWDLVQILMVGIRQAVGESLIVSKKKVDFLDFENETSFDLPGSWTFQDYAPLIFFHLREHFHLSANDYIFSLGPEKVLGNLFLGTLEALCEVVSTARSGSFFFKSMNQKYFIKTLPSAEDELLRELCHSYYLHMTNYPNSLLARIFGSHRLFHKGNRANFIVMENIFSVDFPIHVQYDLKGSRIARKVGEENMSPDSAGKDLDFLEYQKKVRIGSFLKAKLLEQLEADTRWLERNNITDYSLLVGVHFTGETRCQEATSKVAESSNTNRSIFRAKIDDHRAGDGSIFRQDYGGILSTDSSELYALGVIDILTGFDMQKWGEQKLKSFMYDPEQISAMRPPKYQHRFLKFADQIIE